MIKGVRAMATNSYDTKWKVAAAMLATTPSSAKSYCLPSREASWAFDYAKQATGEDKAFYDIVTSFIQVRKSWIRMRPITVVIENPQHGDMFEALLKDREFIVRKMEWHPSPYQHFTIDVDGSPLLYVLNFLFYMLVGFIGVVGVLAVLFFL